VSVPDSPALSRRGRRGLSGLVCSLALTLALAISCSACSGSGSGAGRQLQADPAIVNGTPIDGTDAPPLPDAVRGERIAYAGAAAGTGEARRAPARSGKAVLAIVNGTLIDGTGAGPVKKAVVLIKAGKIVYAGRRGKVAIPRAAKRLDAHGGTILPGFINTHVHNAIDQANLRAWLLGGVTTVRDLGSGSGYKAVFSYRDQLNRNSKQARLLAVGPLITVPGGYPQAIWGVSDLEVSSVEDARVKTGQLIAAGCDTVKIALESGEIFGQTGLPMLSQEEVEAIVEVAHAHGKRVAAHAMVNADLERAVDGGVDEVAHMDVQDAPQELIERMVAAHIDWIPTFELLHLARATIYGDSFKRFVRAGGIVALGTDYDGYPSDAFDLGMPVHELVYMDQLGMTPMQVIQAATKNAAYAVGHPELGVLRRGKVADVIVVRGNPLRDLKVMTKIRLVVHNGTVQLSKLG
jgi:imidazolonepropionase-like amidohydrolase